MEKRGCGGQEGEEKSEDVEKRGDLEEVISQGG